MEFREFKEYVVEILNRDLEQQMEIQKLRDEVNRMESPGSKPSFTQGPKNRYVHPNEDLGSQI